MYYEVITNEEKGSTKYIKSNNKIFSKITWSKYILEASKIDFDKKNNLIRVEPDEKSEAIKIEKSDSFKPIKIQKDWLMIEWDNNKTGWIKWRNNTHILIDILMGC